MAFADYTPDQQSYLRLKPSGWTEEDWMSLYYDPYSQDSGGNANDPTQNFQGPTNPNIPSLYGNGDYYITDEPIPVPGSSIDVTTPDPGYPDLTPPEGYWDAPNPYDDPSQAPEEDPGTIWDNQPAPENPGVPDNTVSPITDPVTGMPTLNVDVTAPDPGAPVPPATGSPIPVPGTSIDVTAPNPGAPYQNPVAGMPVPPVQSAPIPETLGTDWGAILGNLFGHGGTSTGGAGSSSSGLPDWLAALIRGGSALGAGLLGANAANNASQAQIDAANHAADLQRQSAQDQLAFLRESRDQQQANNQPWLDAGKTALGPLTDLATATPKPFTGADLSNDPGYQFRMQQANQALERSAAAKGRLTSGSTLKEITDYNSGLASQEFENAWDRNQTEQNSRFNRLASVAGLGQVATGQANQAAAQTGAGSAGVAQNQGNQLSSLATQAGNARASGYAGSNNAWQDALTNWWQA